MNDPCDSALQRAAELLAQALRQQNRKEHHQAARLARMLEDPEGKEFTLRMVDRVFRSHSARRQAACWRRLVEVWGVPNYLAPWEWLLMRLGVWAAGIAPGPVMSAVASKLRGESAEVILPATPSRLDSYLAHRRACGTRVNLNHLGEAVLGEEQALNRLETVMLHLRNPQVSDVSVKISALFSQIQLLDWEGTLELLCERLGRIYRAALPGEKWVHLDMEEYRDLALTVAAFQKTLESPDLSGARAGIALQAYLPDSWEAQKQLTLWAQRRVAAGGAPIRIRLVKGANLAMETVEAELHGWNPAPYPCKSDTDANFHRMLEFGCQPANARVVRLGVASHNLFDIALALELRERNGVAEHVELEMLEGMANHQARVVQKAAGNLLVYAPVVHREDFNSAMAYLVRRLDENTAPENFLRDLFALSPGSARWKIHADRFAASWRARTAVSSAPRRGELPVRTGALFENEPDTDWTQPRDREALRTAIGRQSQEPWPAPTPLEALLGVAINAQPAWNALGFDARAACLRNCGVLLGEQRFETLAILLDDARKAAMEADTEISEAIDFANYYAGYRPHDTLHSSGRGVVVIAPPWNFPYAIPCSGIFAALMAGNSVVFKPAPETVATGWHLAQQLWRAGVPRDVLQFFPCADGDQGRALFTDPRVAMAVLTGGYETALLFQSWRPELRLIAETSGKNALIVTAQADCDLAIKDLVRSAFGHSGQKCSAASLAILEAEVYDNSDFLRQLRDAAASLRVGEDPAAVITPLIRPPGPDLLRALTRLEPGESWLLEPRRINDCLWSPGIRLGVQPGSWFQRTECFGPVLGLVRARNLEEAIATQNATAFGLTGGLHSLDETEIALWRDRVEVGNAYVNRAITGAIVQRQPFGGWKHSCTGPGAKAGGPNYVPLFCALKDRIVPDEEAWAQSYTRAWETHFSREHDPAGLRAESNIFRYRPCRGVILRLEQPDPRAQERARHAARLCGVPLQISVATEEPDEALALRLTSLKERAEFLRSPHVLAPGLLKAAFAAGLQWIHEPLVAEGRVELTRWLREQSLSETRHRHGQLPASERA